MPHSIEVRRWYHEQRWQRRSRYQMALDPLCCMCRAKGITREANVADHKIPHRGNRNLFDTGELQSLCHDCHRDKGEIERDGYAHSVGPDGLPTDPAHPFNHRMSRTND
jgi:5-methylcytosine-specific restriction enzyme A